MHSSFNSGSKMQRALLAHFVRFRGKVHISCFAYAYIIGKTQCIIMVGNCGCLLLWSRSIIIIQRQSCYTIDISNITSLSCHVLQLFLCVSPTTVFFSRSFERYAHSNVFSCARFRPFLAFFYSGLPSLAHEL